MSWAGNSTADEILCLLRTAAKTAGKNLGSSKKVESTSKLICHSSNCPIDLNEDRLQLKNKQTMSVIWAFLPISSLSIFASFYIFLYFLHLSPFDFCCVLHSLWNLKPSCEMSSNGRCQGASCSFHSKRVCWSLDEATAVATASISTQFNILQRSSKATASGAKLKVYILTALKSETFWNY